MAYSFGTAYHFVSHRGTGRCLNVYGNDQVSQNRNVCLWDWDTTNAQKWVIRQETPGGRIYTNIANTTYGGNGYGLNAYRSGTNWNCDIHTVQGNETDSLIDLLTVNANDNLYRIQLMNYSNRFLTAASTAREANVYWAAESGGDNQVWMVTTVNPGGGTPPGGGTYSTVWPLSSKSTYPITSGFRTQQRPSHDGVDMAAPLGTPIYAIYGGTVSKVTTETSNPLEGISVRIDHDFGTGKTYRYLRSYYLHMQQAAVSAGSAVSKGAVIGYVNNTGDSEGNHLHLGIRYKASAFTAGGDFYEGVDFINPTLILP